MQDRGVGLADADLRGPGRRRAEHAVWVARRDATHRADFLRDLASDRITAERLAREAAVYGLDLAQPYVAVRADVADDAAASSVEARIRRSGATSEHRVFQTVVDGSLFAIAPQAPQAPADVTLAVGSPMLPQDVHLSFAEAEEALATAHAFGVTGPVEHTTLLLLDLDHNVDATAATLHLHRNTVRYRVTRFRDLTGLDLRRTGDLVTAWWLLKWRQSRPGA